MKIPIIYKTGIAIITLLILTTCSKLSVNRSAPDVPSGPAPADGGTLDSLAIELSWTCSDPDGDPLTYDIYLDTSSTPTLLVATVDTTFYAPTGLRYNITYYWKVIATDTTGMFTEGPVWSFGFGADMIVPACSLISPNGGELWYIAGDYDISWQASDDDSIEYFVLEYSIDQGNSWIALGDTLGSGDRSTSWTIPSSPSLQCMVAITCADFGGNVASDTSDAIFTIWPEGGMITFASDRDGDYDIFTVYADGSQPQKLTISLGNETFPVWSPDCFKIAFHSSRDGNSEIYTMNSDGTAQANLTNNPAADHFPDWSPSGDKIVFSSMRRNASYYDIWIMNANGTSQVAITNNNFHEYGADWSPDGEQIVYHNNQYGNWEIMTIDSEGLTAPVRLTNIGSYDAYPEWSPNGHKIVFCSDRDGNYEIYTMNANGSNPRRITNDPATDNHPCWSPDGSRIAFQSNRTGDYEIWTVDPDNLSDLQNISNDLGNDEDPSWSSIH